MKIFSWISVRWLVLGIVVLLVLIQLVPVPRSNPPVTADVAAPPEVRVILRRACYDCHSNETVWPWYSRVAPASWLVAYDVAEGRNEMNFSTWNLLTPEQRAKKLEEAWKQVSEGEMPPWPYVTAHRDSHLSVEDRAALRAWVLGSPGPGADH